MSFKWEISEPTTVGPVPEFQGGAVQLADLKAASSQWHVQPPQASVELAPQSGGEVDLTGKVKGALISKSVLNFVVVALTCALIFIVIYDLVVKDLTFKELIAVIGPLVVALKWRNKRQDD
jgi:hypothetical protein